MTIYRYRQRSIDITQIRQRVPGMITLGDTGPDIYVDVNAPSGSKADLDDAMASLGYDFVSTSPGESPASQSVAETSHSWKNPARTATATNIVLSGLQVVGSVAVQEGDRVLVKAQTDATENGPMIASAGSWHRAKDADTAEKLVPATFIAVSEGTEAGLWEFVTTAPVVFGVTPLTFQKFEGSGGSAALVAHESALDPHPQYLTEAEGDAAYEGIGTAASLIATHAAASDPHPGYLTLVEGNALYDAIGAGTTAAATAVTAHVAVTDPHAQYQKESEKGAASGYASLDGSIKVPIAQIPTLDDAHHGNLSGDALHALATTSTAGFMSPTDKDKLDNAVAPEETVEYLCRLEVDPQSSQSTRVCQTVFEGASYFALKRVTFNRIIFRLTNVNTPGSIRVAIYQAVSGAGGGVANLISNVSVAPLISGNQEIACPVAMLEPGVFYILYGRASASGSVTIRTYATPTYDLLNTNMQSNVHPTSFTTTALAATGAPASFNVLSDFVAVTQDVAPIVRLRKV